MASPDSYSKDIEAAIQAFKAPVQNEINQLYTNEKLWPELWKRWVAVANRASNIEQASLFTNLPTLTRALSMIRFPNEPAEDLLKNTRVIFVDLSPESPYQALRVRLKAFDFGGYGKSAHHQLVVQRAGVTELPANDPLWNEFTKFPNALVSIVDDSITRPFFTDFEAPNYSLTDIPFGFMYRNQEVSAQLAISVPVHNAFAQKFLPHKEASRYVSRAVLLTRYPSREDLYVEPELSVISHPKAGASPRHILPAL